MMVSDWKLPDICLTAGETYDYAWPDTVDLFRADGIGLTVHTASEQPMKLRVTLIPLQNGRPEFITHASAEVLLPSGGGQVEVPFSLFDNHQLVRAHLRYIHAMKLTLLSSGAEKTATVVLTRLGAIRLGNLLVEAERSSRAGETGETLTYRVHLRNGLNQPRTLMLHADCTGREVLHWRYPETLTLPPLGETTVEMTAIMAEAIPAGGHETRCFTILADGCETYRLTLYAAKKQPEPFLLHREEGWQHLRQAVTASARLQEIFSQQYIRVAESWEAPEPATHHRFVYTNNSHDRLLEVAIAWKLTGKPEYLQKIAKWFTGFVDEENGYLATKFCYFEFPKTPEEAPKDRYLVHHANSAGWVQEGEFMARMAIVYDLVRHESCITPRMHEQLEACMRAYMDFVDWRQTDGDGNNFQICEAGAALYFALLLQDEERICRFLSGPNGLQDLIGSVFSDDGSYFEGASGYMNLAASVLGRAAVSCQNAGRNLKDVLVPAMYERNVMHSPWSRLQETSADGKPFLGMSFERFAPVKKPVRCLKDYYDCLLQLVTDEGILMSANDGNEHNLQYVMQLGYFLYHDPAYLKIIEKGDQPDLLFGLHMSPMGVTKKQSGMHLNTGNGFAILREQTAASPVQAVLKFGQHGGYHGHYDRLSLMSVMRDGTTFHNNEYAWFGYGSFLFKMWVQTSVAHNMVVVDGRMQEPTPCEIIHAQEENDFSAVCAQTVARWCDPPYGGQTPYLAQFPYEKCPQEKRWILDPGSPRPQGSIGEYSEPVFQRRLLVLAEGCCFVWDYLQADEEHTFDCLYHPMGALDSKLPPLRKHTARLNRDPFGAGQFIMNCHHYDLNGSIRLHFANDRKRVNHNDMVDFAPHTTLFGIGLPGQTMVIGRYPEGHDTFEHEADYQSPDMLASGCKKTVSFRQTGKTATFITALEIGQQPSGIVSITAEDGETICIRRTDGSARLLRVTGMQSREKDGITVHYSTK